MPDGSGGWYHLGFADFVSNRNLCTHPPVFFRRAALWSLPEGALMPTSPLSRLRAMYILGARPVSPVHHGHENSQGTRNRSLVENRRLADDRVAQRHVRYLGEINDVQARAWHTSMAVFQAGGSRARSRGRTLWGFGVNGVWTAPGCLPTRETRVRPVVSRSGSSRERSRSCTGCRPASVMVCTPRSLRVCRLVRGLLSVDGLARRGRPGARDPRPGA